MGIAKRKTSELYDGLCTLLEKSEELITGIKQLADGAEKLKNGAGEVDTGTGELAAAAGISAPTLTIGNYSEVLNGVIVSLAPDGIAAQA